MKKILVLILITIASCSSSESGNHGSEEDSLEAYGPPRIKIYKSGHEPEQAETIVYKFFIDQGNRVLYDNRELKDSASIYQLIKNFPEHEGEEAVVSIEADKSAKVYSLSHLLKACQHYGVKVTFRTVTH